MQQHYQDIYTKRGVSYHAAMTRWPQARKQEFERVVAVADLPERAVRVVDLPSGGGYLGRYLPKTAHLIAIDPVEDFLRSGQHEGTERIACAPHHRLPLEDGSVESVISLAGLHHIPEQASVFEECFRILAKGGSFVIADGQAGSPTTHFLDGVVGRFNTMGHNGLYLNETHIGMLVETGFQVEYSALNNYTWDFANRREMLDFCRLLFGMDRDPSDADLLAAIAETVGYTERDTSCELHWSLQFIRVRKPL